MSCILIGFGTIGKTVVALAKMLIMLLRHEDIPAVCFDSDSSYAMAIPVTNGQISVAIDGQDVLQAMKDGKFPGFSSIDLSKLSGQSLLQAMKLEPSMGKLASCVHITAIRNALVNLVEMATGDITMLRVFSAFGGTSRGMADSINEIAFDISRSTGRRIHIMDIVTVPGLSTVSSGFHGIYQRNAYAYTVEMSALRTGRCQRLILDDHGNYLSERHEFPPHTLVFVNDTQRTVGTILLEKQLPDLGRLLELFSREEVMRQWKGVESDLDQHTTGVPFCDRAGLFRLYLDNIERLVRERQKIAIRALDGVIEPKVDHAAMSEHLLTGIGLIAPEVERLKLWNPIKEKVLASLRMNPLEDFLALYTSSAQEYTHQYGSLSDAIESVKASDIAGEILEWMLSRGIVDEQIRALRRECPPGEIVRALNNALVQAENEQKDLDVIVNGSEAGIYLPIERYEGNAKEAAESKYRWNRRRALADVKSNLFSALELRLKAAILRVLVSVLSGFTESVSQGEIQIWAETEQQALDLAQVLSDIREEKMAGLLHGNYYRGNSSQLDSRGECSIDVIDGLESRMAKGLHLLLDKLYGKPNDSIRRQVLAYLDRRLKSVDMRGEKLTSSHITQDFFTHALRCAQPTLLVDTTARTSRMATFCFSHLTNCPDMMQRALAETGIRSDREKYIPLHGVNDELAIMTYERGVPLQSIKSLRDCKSQYDRDPESYKGHLDPILGLLPPPIGDLDGELYRLMGIVSGCVTETKDSCVYTDLDGRIRVVSDAKLFSDYVNAVEIASRFIVSLKEHGFAPAMKRLSTMPESDTARYLMARLEFFEALYR